MVTFPQKFMLQKIKKPITMGYYLLFVCLISYGMFISTAQLLGYSYVTITHTFVNGPFLNTVLFANVIFGIFAIFIFIYSVEITCIILVLPFCIYKKLGKYINMGSFKSIYKLAICASPVIIEQAIRFCKLRVQLSNDILHAVIFTTFAYLIVQIFFSGMDKQEQI